MKRDEAIDVLKNSIENCKKREMQNDPEYQDAVEAVQCMEIMKMKENRPTIYDFEQIVKALLRKKETRDEIVDLLKRYIDYRAALKDTVDGIPKKERKTSDALIPYVQVDPQPDPVNGSGFGPSWGTYIQTRITKLEKTVNQLIDALNGAES